MAVCVRTLIKQWFLNGFTVSTYSLIWCPVGWFLGHFLVGFDDPGDAFFDFGGAEEQVVILMIFQGCPGRAQAEGIHPMWGKRVLAGCRKQLTSNPIN